MKNSYNIYLILVCCLILLLIEACTSLDVLYRVEVINTRPRLVVNDTKRLEYIFLKDSVVINHYGVPMLWKEVNDTIQLLNDVTSSITLSNEISRHEYEKRIHPDNLIRHEYCYIHLVNKFFKDKPFIKYDKFIIREDEENDTLINSFLQILKGDFEFRAAYDIYSKMRQNNDSIGIFTSGERYKKYRMVNGIESSRLSLRKKGKGYLFKYKTYIPVTTEKDDTIGPLWLEGYLPKGFTRVTEASPNDMFFEYGKHTIIWIHINPHGVTNGVCHPEDMSEIEARTFINKYFPMTGLYDGLNDIKKQLLIDDKGKDLSLRTDRCTIIAKGIQDKDYNYISSMLHNTFMEKDEKLMMELFLIFIRDKFIMQKYLQEVYVDFDDAIYLYTPADEFYNLINTYSISTNKR